MARTKKINPEVIQIEKTQDINQNINSGVKSNVEPPIRQNTNFNNTQNTNPNMGPTMPTMVMQPMVPQEEKKKNDMPFFLKMAISIDESRVSALVVSLIVTIVFGGIMYVQHGDITANLTQIIIALIVAISGVNALGSVSNLLSNSNKNNTGIGMYNTYGNAYGYNNANGYTNINNSSSNYGYANNTSNTNNNYATNANNYGYTDNDNSGINYQNYNSADQV